MTNPAHAIERQLWDRRKVAFAHWQAITADTTDYDKGLREGALFALDEALSMFRAVLDGTPGAGLEQTAAQRARLQTPGAPS